jgi:hypothetical protein
MKKLIAIAAIVIASVTTAQVKAQTSASFKKEITKFVDSTLKATNSNLTKVERFDCKKYVMVKKFGAQENTYDTTKAHFNRITAFYKDDAQKVAINPETLPIDLVKGECKSDILSAINKNIQDGYDAYDFEVVEINGSCFLVFALGYVNPVDTQEEIDQIRGRVLGKQ